MTGDLIFNISFCLFNINSRHSSAFKRIQGTSCLNPKDQALSPNVPFGAGGQIPNKSQNTTFKLQAKYKAQSLKHK
jgi:hypothetical protein